MGSPVQLRVQHAPLVDCHCYWQRPCNAEWVRWGKTSVNLGFTSLTPVDQLWCKLREGRALVGPTQYAAVPLWCNAAPLRSQSRAIDFHQLASWRGAAVTGFVSILPFLYLTIIGERLRVIRNIADIIKPDSIEWKNQLEDLDAAGFIRQLQRVFEVRRREGKKKFITTKF